jgi:signal transduction histidine kinase
MNIEERIKYLGKIDLFSSFCADEIRSFAQNISEEVFEPNEILFHEGMPGQDMYILLEGSLKIFKDGRTITIIEAIDYVGEMSIIEDKPRSATVQAIEYCRLLKISYKQFQEYFATQPRSLVSLMMTLSQRIRKDTKLIAKEFEKTNILIHDMKNIMSAFLFIDIIKNNPVSKQWETYFQHMHNASFNLQAMMDEALANAKRKHLEVQLIPHSLPLMIKDMEQSDFMIHPDLQKIKIAQSIDQSIPKFPFHPLEIRRVLLNLIVNAAQASKQGALVELSVTQDRDLIEIKIKDQGPGVPAELLDKIFLPNFTTKKTGNGLGLASCKQIVEQRHNGSISFYNNPDSTGTTFQFCLPLFQE